MLVFREILHTKKMDNPLTFNYNMVRRKLYINNELGELMNAFLFKILAEMFCNIKKNLL